mmetsp:Transcript_93517/g.238051  ORF Transcript_93517/g.238051 Transcript_93517/m.238051 type:complete len:364 (-) Transcript_93517:306-1397(-)
MGRRRPELRLGHCPDRPDRVAGTLASSIRDCVRQRGEVGGAVARARQAARGYVLAEVLAEGPCEQAGQLHVAHTRSDESRSNVGQKLQGQTDRWVSMPQHCLQLHKLLQEPFHRVRQCVEELAVHIHLLRRGHSDEERHCAVQARSQNVLLRQSARIQRGRSVRHPPQPRVQHVLRIQVLGHKFGPQRADDARHHLRPPSLEGGGAAVAGNAASERNDTRHHVRVFEAAEPPGQGLLEVALQVPVQEPLLREGRDLRDLRQRGRHRDRDGLHELHGQRRPQLFARSHPRDPGLHVPCVEDPDAALVEALLLLLLHVHGLHRLPSGLGVGLLFRLAPRRAAVLALNVVHEDELDLVVDGQVVHE